MVLHLGVKNQKGVKDDDYAKCTRGQPLCNLWEPVAIALIDGDTKANKFVCNTELAQSLLTRRQLCLPVSEQHVQQYALDLLM